MLTHEPKVMACLRMGKEPSDDGLRHRKQGVGDILDARKRKCPVVVARLDRLSRDVHFISGLMAEKVPFVVTAFGLDVDPFTLHIYAGVAQKERAPISERTKGALRDRVLSGQALRKLTLESEKAIYEAYMNRVGSAALSAGEA